MARIIEGFAKLSWDADVRDPGGHVLHLSSELARWDFWGGAFLELRRHGESIELQLAPRAVSLELGAAVELIQVLDGWS